MIDLWPVQEAIYGALTASPATYRVYDAVPQGAAFPYLVIGEYTVISDLGLDEPSADATINVHAWSRNAGKLQVHEMLEFVRARLDNQDIGSGAGVWACTEDFVEIMEDPSSTAAQRLYHGIARYRARANS